MKIKSIFILILLFVSFNVFAEGELLPVVIDGDEISYLQEEGKIVAKGNVHLEYKGIELFCDEANYDSVANSAYVRGNVKIIRENTTAYGEDVIIDFNTLNAEMISMKITEPPLYCKTQKGQKIGKEKYILRRGYVTTCDLTKPHYRLVSKRITVYPGEKVVAKNVTLKIGKVPIFYLPYVSQSLKDEHFIMNVVPGKHGEWGLFLLTRWRYTMDVRNRGNIFTDLYQDRGQGYGVTHKIENTNFGEAVIKYYTIQDQLYENTPLQRAELFGMYPSRSTLDPKRLEDDRYKAQISHSWDSDTNEDSAGPNLSIKTEFHKFSDEYFLKDFFEAEYEIEPEPLSYNLINYSLDGVSLSLLTQKRANLFFSETEYFPQLECNFFARNLDLTKFYFESTDKIGNLANTTANSREYDKAMRVYSHNTLSYADKIKWLSIKPYIGSYTAFYSNSVFADERLRMAPEAGTTLSTKLYKVFNADLNIFGENIDVMRHVITPEIDYSYIHDPTVTNSSIFQFDGEDSMVRSERVTFTLNNKLQARNKARTWDFLYFSPAVEYLINTEGEESRFDKITADLEIYPKEGISLTADTEYDVNTRRITSFNADITFKGKSKVIEDGEEVEKEKYVITYGQRYTRESSTQGTLDFSYQLTPKLKFMTYLRNEYNTGDLEEQQYKIRADLHCWWLDLGLEYKRREEGSKDYAVWLVFTLKAFPDIVAEFDQGREGAKKTY